MKPAIFNTEMVRAILDGRKTNTRRPFTFKKCIRDYVKSMGQDYCLKHQNKLHGEYDWSVRERSGVWADYTHQQFLDEYAPYKVGDIIYVRDTWTYGSVTGDYDEISGKDELWVEQTSFEEKNKMVIFKADMEAMIAEGISFVDVFWKPSIHMPKEYARLFLRVKDVRIERLNEISYDDALAEGIERDFDSGNEWWLWKDYSTGKFEFEYDFRPEESFGTLWESIYGNGSFDNRYVWVIDFEQISKEEAMSETAT